MIKYPFRLFDALLDRLLVVAGAVGMSQVPAFVDVYLERLGGHVEEARRNVDSWRAIAARFTDNDLAALIARYRATGLPEVVATADKCAADVSRFESLQHALDAIGNAPAWGRLFALVRHADTEIARATLTGFKPRLVLDLESLVYAGIGLILALALYDLLKVAGRALGRRAVELARRRSRAAAA